MRKYLYLVLTSRVQARSSIVGDSAPVVDAQKVFKDTLKALINENYPIGINIEMYQGVSEHELSKIDFWVGTGIYMVLSDLNLSISKPKEYNMDHKKLSPTVPKAVIPVARRDNPKCLPKSTMMKK